MKWGFNKSYPTVDDLRNKARRKFPGLHFEYLDGGCDDDINLDKNTRELRQVELAPYYLNNYSPSSLQTELFGHILL